jgi:hypothetical protein
VDLLCEKLRRFCISEKASNYAARIVGGLLPYLWSTQRITHLDQEPARGQAGALEYALNEALDNTKRRNEILKRSAPIIRAIEESIQNGAKEGPGKYTQALRALDEPNLGSTFRIEEAVNEVLRDLSDNLIAEETSWVLVKLLHTYGTLRLKNKKLQGNTSGAFQIMVPRAELEAARHHEYQWVTGGWHTAGLHCCKNCDHIWHIKI